MAEIFRPVYTSTNPKTGERTRKKSPTWWIRYYLPSGERKKVKGYTDKKATEAKAAELERRGMRLDAGIVDPREEHAKRPLAEHAEDFRRSLEAKGNSTEYVKLVMYRLAALLDNCRFVRLADIQASAVLEYLGTLRDGEQNLGTKTINDYLAAAKSFTRWMWRDNRTSIDVLAKLSKLFTGDADLRHERRDFSFDELQRLLDTARASTKMRRHLSGYDRYVLYLTACGTGFRAKELAAMTPYHLDLNPTVPTAKVIGGGTKNKYHALQPLPLEIADVLREYVAGKPIDQPIWPGQWKSRAFLMVQKDMAVGRAAWIAEAATDEERAAREASDFLVYCNADNVFADFHALRHSYLTIVGKSGCSPREHQDLARHSTYALTARYSHTKFYDLAAAVKSLPIPTGAKPATSEPMAATGTDGNSLGPFLGPQGAKKGDFLRLAETEEGKPAKQQTPGNNHVLACFPGVRKDIEKVEPTGVEPVTSRMPF